MLSEEEPGEGISRNERHLLRVLRDMEYGSMTIHVKDGKPYRVEEKVESILLGTFTSELIP